MRRKETPKTNKQTNNTRHSISKKRSYKEEPNGNFGTEKYKHNVKTVLHGLNSRMEMPEERVNETEDKSIGMIQSKIHRSKC